MVWTDSEIELANTDGPWTQDVEVAKNGWLCYFMSFARRSGEGRPLHAPSIQALRLVTSVHNSQHSLGLNLLASNVLLWLILGQAGQPQMGPTKEESSG